MFSDEESYVGKGQALDQSDSERSINKTTMKTAALQKPRERAASRSETLTTNAEPIYGITSSI
jgi:hypothetical protein